MDNKDVLMVARPDHSLQIYEALSQQNELSYDFLTFKVLPRWLRFFKLSSKAYYVGDEVLVSWWWTFVNLCIFKFRFSFAKKWTEKNLMSRRVSKMLNDKKYKIVYYWPHYCHSAVEAFSANHPNVICMADVHLPNPKVAFESMLPIYKKYGIDPESTPWYKYANDSFDVLVNAPAIMAPSKYVVDTYKNILPPKDYYIVGYGITVSEDYHKQYKKAVKNFVFAGGSITLEKGCDLLCDYFKNHPEFNLHLYGVSPSDQLFIFDPYKKYPNIIFHGFTPKDELQKEIRKYDIGIHLSRFDAYSLSVGEMIGCGLPCVVSKNTGNFSDLVENGWGVGCDLNMDSINMAVMEIANVDNYNCFVDKIDEYIQTKHKPYGVLMTDFLKSFK